MILCCWACLERSALRGAQELFGAFACGGSLVVAAPGGQRDTLYLARLCRQQRVTFAVFVPSQLDGLLQVRSLLRQCLQPVGRFLVEHNGHRCLWLRQC